METLFPEQPLSHSHQTTADVSTPASQPAPENASDLKPHLLYKCLLNQYAQKLRIEPPIYKTQNEGSDHLPRFRSTVCLDGVSYTSSGTFQQRKTAEMDASRIAYIALIQKAKTEALDFIREDKIFSKAIMSEFAAKKNITRPIYETTQFAGSVPVFCSNMLFNGVTYTGTNGKTKKEAEQLVARAVIIRYLDSEAGYDMTVLVNSKLRQFHDMNKVPEINFVQNGSNVSGELTLTDAGTTTVANSSAALESSLGQSTVVPVSVQSEVLSQPIIPQLSVQPVTPAVPFVNQLPTPQVTVVPVVTQPSTSQEAVKPSVEPPVLNPCGTVVSEPFVETPATGVSSGVITLQQPKREASIDHTLEYIPLVGETSNKRRNQKNKKNARKKRRAEAQVPVVPAS